MLYKYPQAAYPYQHLIDENARRGPHRGEYEILDTGVFDAERYFDVTVEYARDAPDDILMRVTVRNRGDAAATLHVLPQLWARNIWGWGDGTARPELAPEGDAVAARHPLMEDRVLAADGAPRWLFCDNDTNARRFPGQGTGDPAGPFKDGINDHVIGGASGATVARRGTKVAAHHVLSLDAGASAVLRLRFRRDGDGGDPFEGHDAVFARRIAEADAFYAAVAGGIADPDARLVQRAAFAGMVWSKQYFGFDVRRWLDGDPGRPPPAEARKRARNHEWGHLVNADIVSMPDTWEYPWYASWDLAFHAIVFAAIDPDFAKEQMLLLLRARCMHPNGQLPAYEWSFGDANPPVAAWAAWRVYLAEQRLTG